MARKTKIFIAAVALILISRFIFAGGQKEQAKTDERVVNVYSRHAANPAWEEFSKVFTNNTGIKIIGTDAPASDYGAWVTKTTAMVSSGDDTQDVLHLGEDTIVSFSRAGFLSPVDEAMPPEVLKQFPKAIMEISAAWNNHIWGVPLDSAPFFLFVNKKMFEKAGLKFPKTAEEFISAAKALTKPKEGIYGYGMCAGRGGFLFNEYVRWMMAYNGSYKDWSLPGTREALKFMHDAIHTYGIVSESAVAETYDTMNQKMLDGKFAMIFQWPYIVGFMGDKFGEEFTIIPVPTFKTNKTLNGSWFYSINKAGHNQKEAMELIKFAASKEGQQLLLKPNNNSVARIDVLTDLQTAKINPILKIAGEYAAADSLTPRELDENFNALMENQEAFIQDYLTNTITLDQLMERGNKFTSSLYKK
ncbi:MAG: extracellular solute-binding protein [Spirochaetota bacterium]